MLLKISPRGSSICINKLAEDFPLSSLFLNHDKKSHYHYFGSNHCLVSANKQQRIESPLKEQSRSSKALLATSNRRLSDGQSSPNNSSVDTSQLHDLTKHNYASATNTTTTITTATTTNTLTLSQPQHHSSSSSYNHNCSRTSSMVPPRMGSYTKEEFGKCPLNRLDNAPSVALFHSDSGQSNTRHQRNINCLTKRFLSSKSWLAKSIEFSTPSSYKPTGHNQHQLKRQVTNDSRCASDYRKHNNNKQDKHLSLSKNNLTHCDDNVREDDKRNDRSIRSVANNDWRPGEDRHQIRRAIVSNEETTIVETKLTKEEETIECIDSTGTDYENNKHRSATQGVGGGCNIAEQSTKKTFATEPTDSFGLIDSKVIEPSTKMQARRVRNNTDEELSDKLANIRLYTSASRARNAEHNRQIREEIAKQVMTGKKQSPISLMSQNPIYKQCNKPLMLEYPTTLDNLKLNNTGFTWEVKLPYQQSMLTAMSGASLPYLNRYRLDQFHCHWGADNKAGSEHSVDGHLYTAELHFVHYNMEKYHSMSKAQLHPDGLAVVAVFLEASNDHLNHAELDKISTNLRLIPNKGDSITLKQSIRLDNLLPIANRSYWTYHGSLTTPPFYESVTWFVLKQPIKCSVAQIDKFRQIHGSPCCSNNFSLTSSSNNPSSFSKKNNNDNNDNDNNNNNNISSISNNNSTNNNNNNNKTANREDSAGSSKPSIDEDSSTNNNNVTTSHKCAKNILSNHRATQPLHGRVVCNHDDECSSYPRSIIRL